jgi:hypothetical protein
MTTVFSPKPARFSAALISMTLLAGGGILAAAPPAQAASIIANLPQVAVAYTDSANPAQSYPDPRGDLPLGAWTDAAGTTHVSRVYATFDLSGYTGEKLLTATAFVQVAQGTDCSAGDIQVWQTALPDQTPTWAQAPAEKKQLGTVGVAQCVGTYLHLDVTAAAATALASGQHELAIELRLSTADEQNVSLGRQVTAPQASITYDTAPAVPVNLFNDYQACSTKQSAPAFVSGGYNSDGGQGPSVILEGQVKDPDLQDVSLNADYLIWPVADSTQVTSLTASSSNGFEVPVTTPGGLLTDGQTYAWQTRADDGQEQSGWSKTCYFTVDATRPAAAPTISSANYPAGVLDQGGKPIKFTLGANGISDVAGYEFSWQQTLGVIGASIGAYGVPQPPSPYSDTKDFVRASALGGPATLSLVPPSSAGPVTLYVVSLDRAYNESSEVSYSFYVTDTSPTVSPAVLPFDTPTVLTLTPNKSVGKVLSYSVQLGNSQPETVQAAADGTAQVTVNPVSVNSPDGNVVTVTSNSANGWVSSIAREFFYYDTTPTVSSNVYLEEGSDPDTNGGVGIPGTFTFALALPNIASYTYSFDGDTSATVPADATGTGQVTWAPDSSGSHMLVVNANTTDGITLDSYYYFFDVN